jgi:hypothetical protein
LTNGSLESSLRRDSRYCFPTMPIWAFPLGTTALRCPLSDSGGFFCFATRVAL